MKILFFGTPEIAVPFLEEAVSEYEVVACVTQPDKPASRHLTLQSPAVKVKALENKLPVFQPEKFTQDIMDKLKQLNADIGVIVSYGKLIPENVYSIPKKACFNIHFSLLPKYRGAAPVQWALIKGEQVTGVTSFWIEKTLDSGPILAQKTVPIDPQDDADKLFKKLIPAGIEIMNETLQMLEKEKVAGKKQEGIPTFAPILKKEDGKIDWGKSAEEILNLMRGTILWPGAYTIGAEGKFHNKRLKIIKAELFPLEDHKRKGEIIEIVKNDGFVVACGKNSLLVKEVHPENKNLMSAWSFLQGGFMALGSKFV